MDLNIKLYQEFLKTNPFGISYSGISNGIFSDDLKSKLLSLQLIIKEKLLKNDELKSKAANFKIFDEETIVLPVSELKLLIEKIEKPDINIKKIQEIFNTNPFNIVYSGPKDGIINPEFIAKIKELETKISDLTGAAVSGKIILDNKVISNSAELIKTFEIIKQYQNFIKKT